MVFGQKIENISTFSVTTSSPGRCSLALGAGRKPGKSALGTRLFLLGIIG